MPVTIASLAAFTLALTACAGARSPAPAPNPASEQKETTKMTLRTHVMGQGAPLVLIGGGLTGWLSWIPHQERLAASRRVARAQLLIVQLGLENRPVPAGYSVKMESAALAAAIDGFHAEGPLDLVAWSFGAFVTLDYALDHPERVRTLTLIEPPAFWVLEATRDPAYEQEREALRPLADRIRDDVTEADLVEFVHFASLCPPGTRPQDLPQWPVWLEHRRSLRRQFDVAFDHRDTIDRVRAFDRPVLLVKGTGSTPVLHRILDTLGEALPHARALELDGGHAPQIVEMDAFLEALARFHTDAGSGAELVAPYARGRTLEVPVSILVASGRKG
jgi:pimeloyl-ACP methyl ester carboxylesterase